MADAIEVPLGINDFEVTATELVGGVLEVHVRSTWPAACWHCGSTAVAGHGRLIQSTSRAACVATPEPGDSTRSSVARTHA